MTTYMKYVVGSNSGTLEQKSFNIVTLFRAFTHGKSHMELVDSAFETEQARLPYEVEEKIRLFRQKHFKD